MFSCRTQPSQSGGLDFFDVFDTQGPVGVLLATCDTTVSLVIHGELHDDDDDVYSTPARD